MSTTVKWTVNVDYKFADVASARGSVVSLSQLIGWTSIRMYANSDGTYGTEVYRNFATLADAFAFMQTTVTQAGFTGASLKQSTTT